MTGVATPPRVSLNTVPIPLPLGMPPSRDEPRGLLDALLTGSYPDLAAASAHTGQAYGAPIVPATEPTAGRDIVVTLDASAEPPAPSGHRPVRYQLDCAADDLTDVLAFTAPAPLAVYVDVPGSALADTARALVDAGHIPGLPAGHSPAVISDFLSVLAHADTGYVARATTGADVLALLSGTAAALSGFDARAALEQPRVDRLAALIPEAAAALREVLLTVEVPDPAAVVRELADLGLNIR